MLEIVSRGFKSATEALMGKATLTEENIELAMRQIRVALLEADVELQVAKDFLNEVKRRALGTVVTLKVDDKKRGQKLMRSPADHFVKICYDELVALMGQDNPTPIVFRRPATLIMMVGLQGVGKTTTCGKLAKTLLAQGRKPLLVGADVQRPAAQAQLKTLADTIGVPAFCPTGISAEEVCQKSTAFAREHRRDVIILDTAGRLAIDAPLMQQLIDIKGALSPHEVLLVCDAMTGQDAVKTAQSFNEKLQLTGLIMTKLDGDARGGAALSIRAVTKQPIKYLGVGEALDKLERFRPQGLASRILGKGDIVGLMEDFGQVVDEKQAERDGKKLLRGQFTLDDFLGQIKLIEKMGSIKDLIEKVPIPQQHKAQVDPHAFKSMRAVIQSMTPFERQQPSCIDASRAKRIAMGAGRKVHDVTGLVERFGSMQKMMSGMGKTKGLMGRIPGLKNLAKLRDLNDMNLPSLADGGGLPGLGMPRASAGSASSRAASMMNKTGSLGSNVQAGAELGGQGDASNLSPEQLEAYQDMQRRMGLGPRKDVSNKQRDRAKLKRKAEKQARKKARR